ncbi:MAG TPA: hypothetical protein VGP44_04530 [Gemmatimonadales bacterium]|nr:hypothetical protein [Gemmatimonadales bacterium]
MIDDKDGLIAMMMAPYAEHQRAASPGLQRLLSEAESMAAQEQAVALLEQTLKTAKERLRQQQEVELPALCDELGISTVTLSDGRTLSVAPFVTASISGKLMSTVLAWLRANAHDGIIVNELSVKFPKGAETRAQQARRLLADAGYLFDEKTTVNTTSFKALVRELLRDGIDVPTKDLGVYVGRRCVLTTTGED